MNAAPGRAEQAPSLPAGDRAHSDRAAIAKRGVLLFAHGARDPRWSAPFEAVARRIAADRPDVAVALGFLEFMAPDLRGAGQVLVDAGCDRVDVVPLFLGAGGHVRNDVPALLAGLAAAHPHVAWTLRPAIGEAPLVIEAMARAALDQDAME
jgi:sirohydrochlorin cobaltochelatase